MLACNAFELTEGVPLDNWEQQNSQLGSVSSLVLIGTLPNLLKFSV